MATMTITDLPTSHVLDRNAMSCIRGASGANWLFGWIAPFMESTPSRFPVVNIYQINNFADQMINQYQMVSVINSAANSTLNVKVAESSVNQRL